LLTAIYLGVDRPATDRLLSWVNAVISRVVKSCEPNNYDLAIDHRGRKRPQARRGGANKRMSVQSSPRRVKRRIFRTISR